MGLRRSGPARRDWMGAVERGRAFARAEGQGYGIYRRRDRRMGRLGHVPQEAVRTALASGSLVEVDGWIGAREPLARLPDDRAPVRFGLMPGRRRETVLERLARQAGSETRARRWQVAAGRYAGDVERLAGGAMRSASWDFVPAGRGRAQGPCDALSPSGWRAAQVLRRLREVMGEPGLADLDRLLIREWSLSAMAAASGLSLPACEARLSARLDALCEAYDRWLPPEASGD